MTLATVAGWVVITLLVMRALPSQTAHPQVGLGAIQANEFDVVAQNGTVVAPLGTGPNGNGMLRLFDSAGNKRADLVAGGMLTIFDPDGVTRRFRAGYDLLAGTQINGVQLDPNGGIGPIRPPP